MAAILALPTRSPYTMKKGDSGAHVWGLQRGLNGVRVPGQVMLTEDGDFGPATEKAVREYQQDLHLTVDGIAGPSTQKALVNFHVARRDNDVPRGLLNGFAEMEGGWLIGPVNWSVPGGVDCGGLQRRVYDDGNVDRDYWMRHVEKTPGGIPTGACDTDLRNAVTLDAKAVQRAFDIGYQAGLLNDSLATLSVIYASRPGTKDGYGGMGVKEKAGRLAALDHNYPSGADTLSRTPVKSLSAYWTTPQPWVTGFGLKFPDGAAVRTPLEWAHRYAGVLAGAHQTQGMVTKYVKAW